MGGKGGMDGGLGGGVGGYVPANMQSRYLPVYSIFMSSV